MNEMVKLCKQLESFHISAALLRVADEQAIFADPQKIELTRRLLHKLPFAENFNCGLLDADLFQNKMARKLLKGYHSLGMMNVTCQIQTMTVDLAGNHECQIILGSKLSRKQTRSSLLEKASKAFHGERMPWTCRSRRDCLHDIRISWLDSREVAGGGGDWQEERFWDTLSRALGENIDEVANETEEILRRLGKNDADWWNNYDRITEVAREKDASFGKDQYWNRCV